MPPLFNDMDVWLFPTIYPKDLVHHPNRNNHLFTWLALEVPGAAGIAMDRDKIP